MTVRRFGFQPKGWCLSRSGNRSEHFRRYFGMGRIRGTPYMRSHIFVHRATTKYFSNSFVFKTEIEKEGLPGDITPALGVRRSRVQISAPRPKHIPCFLWLIENSLHSKLPCGIPPDRRAQFANRLVSRSSPAWRIGPNPFQLGGSFIFAAGNIDRFAHVSKTFGDNASPATLLAALDQIEYQA